MVVRIVLLRTNPYRHLPAKIHAQTRHRVRPCAPDRRSRAAAGTTRSRRPRPFGDGDDSHDDRRDAHGDGSAGAAAGRDGGDRDRRRSSPPGGRRRAGRATRSRRARSRSSPRGTGGSRRASCACPPSSRSRSSCARPTGSEYGLRFGDVTIRAGGELNSTLDDDRRPAAGRGDRGSADRGGEPGARGGDGGAGPVRRTGWPANREVVLRDMSDHVTAAHRARRLPGHQRPGAAGVGGPRRGATSSATRSSTSCGSASSGPRRTSTSRRTGSTGTSASPRRSASSGCTASAPSSSASRRWPRSSAR